MLASNRIRRATTAIVFLLVSPDTKIALYILKIGNVYKASKFEFCIGNSTKTGGGAQACQLANLTYFEDPLPTDKALVVMTKVNIVAEC